MGESKQERYVKISKELVKYVGGMENIQGVAHCATRLRLVLRDNGLADMEKLENIDLVKGVFTAGNQLQLIFGAGLVNEVYDVFSKYTHTENMSLGDIKAQSAQKQNPVQAVIKSLSDVFVDIIPGILAAALLMGITGVLSGWEVVASHATLYALNKLASLAATGIFAILPMAVCYSACKRYGGKPILGLVVGAIMLDSSLANAYAVGNGTAVAEVIHLFGLPVELTGFQGGIIIALMMGFVVAKLDGFFDKKIPDVVKLLLSPLCTVFLSTLLLFTVVGPAGRWLSQIITAGLVWMTQNLGAAGYMIFAGVQQIIVITGLHHIIGAIEAQLIADTGRNFLNPLMSVALMGQGGAVLGYLALNWKNVKARELCIPSFASTLFGISEPAIFGVNLRYRYPLIAGCLGGAAAGAYVYFADLAAFGFGTTAVPGIAICRPENNGYFNYVVAHLIALAAGVALAVLFGKIAAKKNGRKEGGQVSQAAEPAGERKEPQEAEPAKEAEKPEGTKQPAREAKQPEGTKQPVQIQVASPVRGVVKNITESKDATFAAGTLGDGIVVETEDGEVTAPCDGTIAFVFESKHAVGMRLEDGSGLMIHCGIDTVQLNGEGFEAYVQTGQEVKKGERLLSFDKKKIEDKGYSTETVMTLEPADGSRLELSFTGKTDCSDAVAVIRRD